MSNYVITKLYHSNVKLCHYGLIPADITELYQDRYNLEMTPVQSLQSFKLS